MEEEFTTKDKILLGISAMLKKHRDDRAIQERKIEITSLKTSEDEILKIGHVFPENLYYHSTPISQTFNLLERKAILYAMENYNIILPSDSVILLYNVDLKQFFMRFDSFDNSKDEHMTFLFDMELKIINFFKTLDDSKCIRGLFSKSLYAGDNIPPPSEESIQERF